MLLPGNGMRHGKQPGGSVKRVWGAWNGTNLCEARTHRKCSSISLRLQHPGQRMLRSDSADLPTSWANIWQRFADFCAACVSTGVGEGCKGVYPGLALAAEVSLKVTAAVAVAVVAQ